MSRLSDEMEIVPRPAWVAAALSVVGVAALYWVVGSRSTIGVVGGLRVQEIFVLGLVAAVFSVYVLIIGYIVSDAKRRGMPVVLWTLLAIFVPSAIGIILYFILRRPLLRTCSQCGKASDVAHTFCPACGANLGRTCPACHNAVESGWAHCAKCGAALNPV